MNGLILFLAASLATQINATENRSFISFDDNELSAKIQVDQPDRIETLIHSNNDLQPNLRHVVFKQTGTTGSEMPRITPPGGQYSFQNSNGTTTTQNSTYTPPVVYTAQSTQAQQETTANANTNATQLTLQQQQRQQYLQALQQEQQQQNAVSQTQTTQDSRLIPQFNPALTTQQNTQQTTQQQETTTLSSHAGLQTKTPDTQIYQKNFSAFQSPLSNNLQSALNSNQQLGLNPLTQPIQQPNYQQPNANFSSYGQQPTQLNQQLYQNRQVAQQTQQSQQPTQPTINPFQTGLVNPYGIQSPYRTGITGYVPYPNQIGYVPNQQPQVEKTDKSTLVESIREALKPVNDKIAALEADASKVTLASQQQITPEKEPAKKSNSITILWLLVFGLVGACFYLAWIAQTFYYRYRTLSDEMRETFLDRGTT